MRRRVLISALLLTLSSRTGYAQTAEAPQAKIGEAITTGVLAALDGDGKAAHRALTSAGLMAPDLEGVRDLIGLAALVTKDSSRARELLAGRPRLALYLAMAQAEGTGGLALARETLAAHARLPDTEADPGALFLAALAFSGAGEDTRAQELLDRAVKLAPSALDESFAPDPGSGLAREAIAVIEKSGAPEPEKFALTIAKKLLEKGRRHAAVSIASKLSGGEAHRVVASGLERGDPRRALEEIDLVLKEGGAEPEEAALKRVELLAALGEIEDARPAERALGALKSELRARRARVKAKLALEKGGDPKTALEAAESAASLDPKSTVALALLCRALLANGHVDRAFAFANELLKRKPREVDPFAILEAIAAAKKETSKIRTIHLRSEAFRGERERADRERERREHVLHAVRDAERGLGIAGLNAVRGEEPMLALPLDLATAKSATPGFKRAARDRILAACRGDLSAFLRSVGPWDRVVVPFSPYGAADELELPLGAADPGRCTQAPQRTRAPGSR